MIQKVDINIRLCKIFIEIFLIILTFGYGLTISSNDCRTNSGNTGLCMKRIECRKNGGSASGFCGTFGVCCDMNLLCNGISKLKRTIIKNPITLPQICEYHFQPYNSNVCQLRIDFDMTLAQPMIPNSDQNDLQYVSCVLDEFRVDQIIICGTNVKQHIYLPFGNSDGITDLSLKFKLANRTSSVTNLITPSWNMIVTQLECPQTKKTLNTRLPSFDPKGIFSNAKIQENYEEHLWSSIPTMPYFRNLQDLGRFFFPQNNYIDTELLAPPGCLQYFTEKIGTIESFNFNGGKGPYMSNMRYAICFKRNYLDKGVRLTALTFEIGAANDNNTFVDSDCHDIIGTTGRPNDYLMIAESILDSIPTLYANYYCGTSLEDNTVVHAPPGPFAIYFMSDALYSALSSEIGFKINYVIQ